MDGFGHCLSNFGGKFGVYALDFAIARCHKSGLQYINRPNCTSKRKFAPQKYLCPNTGFGCIQTVDKIPKNFQDIFLPVLSKTALIVLTAENKDAKIFHYFY
jgi:hypothetical protein